MGKSFFLVGCYQISTLGKEQGGEQIHSCHLMGLEHVDPSLMGLQVFAEVLLPELAILSGASETH